MKVKSLHERDEVCEVKDSLTQGSNSGPSIHELLESLNHLGAFWSTKKKWSIPLQIHSSKTLQSQGGQMVELDEDRTKYENAMWSEGESLQKIIERKRPRAQWLELSDNYNTVYVTSGKDRTSLSTLQKQVENGEILSVILHLSVLFK